jgi:hypothetical protein
MRVFPLLTLAVCLSCAASRHSDATANAANGANSANKANQADRANGANGSKSQVGKWAAPEVLATVQSDQIDESSGLAASWREKDVYYTHNDSGDTARFFKFDVSGKLLGTYTLRGASAIDWEDMASANGYLYFGDIGDNLRMRKNIVVYRVKEPAGPSGDLTEFDTYTLTYPDQAHNAESLMVHPKTGDIYVVTKVTGEPSKVFRLKRPLRSGGYKLTEIGKISFPTTLPGGQLTTAGDFSRDGRSVVVRTYFAAYEWSFDKFPAGLPGPIKLANERQGEAISYSPDGRSLLTTSEGSPCVVSVVRRE